MAAMTELNGGSRLPPFRVPSTVNFAEMGDSRMASKVRLQNVKYTSYYIMLFLQSEIQKNLSFRHQLRGHKEKEGETQRRQWKGEGCWPSVIPFGPCSGQVDTAAHGFPADAPI